MSILRAVIYCRCSTEEESQVDALAKQVIEAKEAVKRNHWLLVIRLWNHEAAQLQRGEESIFASSIKCNQISLM